jgi:hypothetical protein
VYEGEMYARQEESRMSRGVRAIHDPGKSKPDWSPLGRSLDLIHFIDSCLE